MLIFLGTMKFQKILIHMKNSQITKRDLTY